MPDRALDWLDNCQGFRAEVAGKRVGVVEEVLHDADRGKVVGLLLRGGLFGTKITLVSSEDVVDVMPRSQRVVLRDGAAEPS
jgi:uncharacterized protein YrrD